MIDNIYAGLWAKPGTNAIVPSPDGTYDAAVDTCSGCGNYLYAGMQGSKFWGQMFGLSRQDNWPVLRIGGSSPPQNAAVYVSGRIGDIAGAASYRVTVTEPSGIVSAPVICSSSPCAVTINRALGNPIVQVDYLSATGAVLHSGEPFVVTVN